MDFGFIAKFLSEPSDARAIVLGVLATWALSDTNHTPGRTIIGGIVGVTVVMLLSLDPWTLRLGLALVVGSVSPFLYQYVSKATFHFFPWLGAK